MSRAYATLNGINLDTAYGLRLTDYSVGTPVPDIRYIEVPGRPGGLDATLALNGKVNYKSRPISLEFQARNVSYAGWHTRLESLIRDFNGTESKLVLSTDPNWYYKGRFQLETEKTNPVTGNVSITCDQAFPYKLESYEVEDTVTSSRYVYCAGLAYNGAVTIYTSAVMSVVFQGKTYQLSAGNNKVPEIQIAAGTNSLRFLGSGTVRVTYERGIL